MKKILCSLLLVGFAYSTTGNTFLEKYPHGKQTQDYSDSDELYTILFESWVQGIIAGNRGTYNLLRYTDDEWPVLLDAFDLYVRTCEFTMQQKIRILKKYCDDNPTRTHLDFSELVFEAYLGLPIDNNCLDK